MGKIKESIYIIGAGTYGEVMQELADECGYVVEAFFDDNYDRHGEFLNGIIIEKAFVNLEKDFVSGKKFIVAIGNNKVRQEMMDRIISLDGLLPSIIHPSAIISQSAQIGEGSYIQANVVVWSYTTIGKYNIISPNVVVAHHTTTGEACLISTLSGVGASIIIEDRVFIGMGSTIVTGVKTIKADSLVGAGAVVIRDIDITGVYAGVPAKKITKK